MAKPNNPTITVELASPTTEKLPQPTTTVSNKPVEQLTIPVRPALITAANLVTTTTAAAAVSGPVGLAILTGAAMTGAAVARHHHNQRRTRAHRETTQKLRRLGGLSRGSGGLGGFGLGGFGKTSRTGHGKSAGLGGHPGRKHRNPLGGLAGALKRATSPRHSGHTSRVDSTPGTSGPRGTGGTHGGVGRRHSSHLGASRTPRGTLGRMLHHPTIRATRHAVRRAVPTLRAAGKSALLCLGGLGYLLNHLYKAMRWLAWNLRKLFKPHENDPKPQKYGKHVSDTITEPNNGSDNDDDDQQKPTSQRTAPEPGRIPAMSGTSGLSPNNHQGTSPMFMIMKRACDEIASLQHKGNMTTRAEAYDMAAILAMIGQAIGLRAGVYRKESLDPTFVDLYAKAEAAMYAVANQMLPLGSYFDGLHPERVRDLLAGSNPAAWDTTNNQTIG